MFIAIIWVLQELTKVRILRYVILFIGTVSSLLLLVSHSLIHLFLVSLTYGFSLVCQVL